MNINDDLIQKVWNKGGVVQGYSPDDYRKDACGAWIKKTEFGNHESPFGWDIDHIFPQSKLFKYRIPLSIIDHLTNLRPMQWQNNQSKGADYPSYMSAVTSDGSKNVEEKHFFTVNQRVQEVLNQLYDSYLK